MQRAFIAQTTLETNLFPPLSAPVVFRPYRDNDYDACMAIYRKNEPGRFPPGHISTFEQFLRRDAKTCIITEVDSKVAACGGLLLEAPDLAILCYGLVDPAFQGFRIGSTLTLLRIALVPVQPADTFFLIYAVDQSMPFYRRFGFIERGRWNLDDKDYPIGLLRVSYREMERVKNVLEQRNIRVDGQLALHPSHDIIGEVVYGPNGFQIVFRPRTTGPAA